MGVYTAQDSIAEKGGQNEAGQEEAATEESHDDEKQLKMRLIEDTCPILYFNFLFVLSVVIAAIAPGPHTSGPTEIRNSLFMTYDTITAGIAKPIDSITNFETCKSRTPVLVALLVFLSTYIIGLFVLLVPDVYIPASTYTLISSLTP